MHLPIYLDNHATTRCDPRVVEAMLPYFSEHFGNASSVTHAFGWRARDALEAALGTIAAALGADARDLWLTSGATEANNLALFGAARARRGRAAHIVTCTTEHPSILDSCRALEKEEVRVSVLPVNRAGLVSPDAVAAAIESDTVLVSIAHANAEIGVLQPIAEIAELTRARGVPLHTDATQSLGKVQVDVAALGVDLLSCSAHKLYGPKGIGALFVRRRPRVPLVPILYGGGSERDLRSGTAPVALAVGFARACEIAVDELEPEGLRVGGLRDRLLERLSSELPSIRRNGEAENVLPGNLNLCFEGVEGEALLLGLPELALSSGSACSSSRREPSHVLRALGLGRERALSSIRFGLGRFNTAEEIEFAADRIVEQVQRLRSVSPLWDDRRA
ncbi:MAG: cysteine desulfurase [Myxococcales bacterium]|nr:cysteine desulfurase [Myxococcales bacterium]